MICNFFTTKCVPSPMESTELYLNICELCQNYGPQSSGVHCGGGRIFNNDAQFCKILQNSHCYIDVSLLFGIFGIFMLLCKILHYWYKIMLNIEQLCIICI